MDALDAVICDIQMAVTGWTLHDLTPTILPLSEHEGLMHIVTEPNGPGATWG